jgi:hypothetical protein
MLNRPENVFVGDEIRKEVKGYADDQVKHLITFDVLNHSNPAFKFVSETQNLSTIVSRVMKIKLVPNKLDSFAKWEDPNLVVQQVENLVVEAFTLAKVGMALLGGLVDFYDDSEIIN